MIRTDPAEVTLSRERLENNEMTSTPLALREWRLWRRNGASGRGRPKGLEFICVLISSVSGGILNYWIKSKCSASRCQIKCKTLYTTTVKQHIVGRAMVGNLCWGFCTLKGHNLWCMVTRRRCFILRNHKPQQFGNIDMGKTWISLMSLSSLTFCADDIGQN